MNPFELPTRKLDAFDITNNRIALLKKQLENSKTIIESLTLRIELNSHLKMLKAMEISNIE